MTMGSSYPGRVVSRTDPAVAGRVDLVDLLHYFCETRLESRKDMAWDVTTIGLTADKLAVRRNLYDPRKKPPAAAADAADMHDTGSPECCWVNLNGESGLSLRAVAANDVDLMFGMMMCLVELELPSAAEFVAGLAVEPVSGAGPALFDG